MPRKPMDLECIRKADAELAQLLEAHPELREASEDRQAALDARLEDLEEEENHGETEEI